MMCEKEICGMIANMNTQWINCASSSISLYNVPNLSLEYDYMNDVGAIVNPCSNSTITQWSCNNDNPSL